jgi:hypothetical protein
MKLPIQSQPILRNISAGRTSYASSMVHPQECVPPWVALRECDGLPFPEKNSCRAIILANCNGNCC